MQNWRHKNGHGKGRPQPTPEQRAAARERADAERMARPAPPYPVEHQPGELLRVLELRDATGNILGTVTLHAPAKLPRGRRSRVDSYEVRSPWGDVLVERGGLHDACRAAIRSVWPRELPRDAVASMSG